MILNRLLSHIRFSYYLFNTSVSTKFCHSQPSSTVTESKAVSKDVSHSDNESLDKLYKTLEVEVRGHDNAVLKSYQTFVTIASKELDIKLEKWRTLLRAAFVKKKYRVQYEWRTHFRVMQFKHVTGSTADTFIEYIQRNLPEGVAMKVNKVSIERMPIHIKPPENTDADNSNKI